MDKNKLQARAMEFLEWANGHYNDWISMGGEIYSLPMSDPDAIESLRLAYRHGMAEIFFIFFFCTRTNAVFDDARSHYFLWLLQKETARHGMDVVMQEFEQVFRERQSHWNNRD